MMTLRKLLAAAMALLISLSSVEPAWAQRRREEPQANPQFSPTAAPDSGGRPLGGPIEPGAAPAAAAPAEAGEEEPGGRVQGVTIGALSPAKPSQALAVSPLESRVSLRVKGAPLATFLDTISAQAKINFIITEGIETKPVTAFLQNVTVREALQILLEIKGLTYQQIGKSNTYVIAPRANKAVTLITRIYTLNHIPLIPIQNSGGGAAAGATITGAGANTNVGTTAGAGGSADTGIPIVNVLRSVMSTPGSVQGSPGGQVSLDPRTNSLIITDIPEVFPQVEQIIQELDKKMVQVMIEAQIVEIDSDRLRDLGISWGSNGVLASFTGGSRQTTFPLSLNSNMGKSTFFDPLQSRGGTVQLITNTANGQAGAVQAAAGQAPTQSQNAGVVAFPNLTMTPGIVDLTSLSVVLRALVTRAEARFLGKPKVLTLNNSQAFIHVGALTGLARQTQSTSVGAAGATAATTVERQDTGITLRVTPQVNKEGYITMLVNPSVSDINPSAISTPSDPTFDPTSRTVSTLVRVKNGQTLVLGGLLQSREAKSVNKLPFLGSIPLLGWLFTSTHMERHNIDLVVFLTPTIVSD